MGLLAASGSLAHRHERALSEPGLRHVSQSAAAHTRRQIGMPLPDVVGMAADAVHDDARTWFGRPAGLLQRHSSPKCNGG
jgi:hypothetical protein